MAYRQYVGARYVPLFDGAWDATKNYEPLTVVEDGNGNSYTSKKDVPAGTPLTDRNYWMLTASFSGAVQQLQNRVTAAEQDIDALGTSLSDVGVRVTANANNIDALETSLSDVGVRVTANANNIDDINNRLGSSDVLVVSDSYGATTDENNKTSATLFAEYTGIPTHLCAAGGASFQQGTLLQALQNYSTQYDDNIGTIIIYCGANDCGASSEAIITGITNFISYAKNRFAKCRRIVLCGCGLTFGEANGGAVARDRLIRNYIAAAARNGIEYCTNSEYVLHNTQLLQADLCHPNAAGVKRLAEMLVAAYKTGSDDVHYEITVAATLATETTTADKILPAGSTLQIGSSLKMKLDNNLVTIESPNYYTIMQVAMGAVGTLGGSYCVLDLSDTLVQHDIVVSRQSFSLAGLVYQQSGNERYCEFNSSIATKKMYFAVTGGYNAASIENVSAITITQASATMPAT